MFSNKMNVTSCLKYYSWVAIIDIIIEVKQNLESAELILETISKVPNFFKTKHCTPAFFSHTLSHY